MKYFLKLILFCAIWLYVGDIVVEHFLNKVMPMAVVEIPGVKVEISKNDDWGVIAKVLVAVLGTYAGFKVINRIFK